MSSRKRSELVRSLTREVRKSIAASILFNETVAASVGLNGTDLQFLHLLELQEAATPGDLARWSGLTTGGVTVVLDRLEKAGYVKRKPNPADRRSTIVRPVAARLRKLASRYQSKSDLLLRAVSQYRDSELQLILDFFRRTNAADQQSK
jgi:DNA-binding MarR family transcriptional regulator